MILAQLKEYLAERGPVPMAGLTARFAVTPETMRGMLSHLVRRGLVRPVRGGEICGGCTKCEANVQEIYAWIRTEDMPSAGTRCMTSSLSFEVRIHST